MKSETSITAELSLNKLEEAFSIFNQVSADLGSSYQSLEAKVTGLKEELAASNSARIRELTEKERLAAKLSSLMDALPGGVIVIDTHGTVKQLNPAAQQIIGKKFTGENWQHVLGQMTSTEEVKDGEFSLHDGKRVSIASCPFGDDGDRILLVTDITENYRLNNLISREKRLTALGEMAARLAHQIRTPLSSAILYLSNLSTQFSSQKSLATDKTIKSIQSQLGQIESLVVGMLSYIKGDISAKQEFSPLSLLEEVKQATALQVESAKGQLNLVFSGDDLKMVGDKEALFNALTNLVINAVQAVDKEPLITLSLVQEDDCVHIGIADSGPGIDQSIRDQIFDPFFTTREGGTGLGLAVVLSAINAHDGNIVIDSPPGGGTIFTLTIPFKEEALSEVSELEESRIVATG